VATVSPQYSTRITWHIVCANGGDVPPAGIKVDWNKDPNAPESATYTCTLTINDPEQVKARSITLQARPATPYPSNCTSCECVSERILSVDTGKGGCTSGSCAAGGEAAGDGGAGTGCVDAWISLGRGQNGTRFGQWFFYMADWATLPTGPSPSLITNLSMALDWEEEGVDAVELATGGQPWQRLKQVYAPEAFSQAIGVQPQPEDEWVTGFDVEFYWKDMVQSTRHSVTGMYYLVPGATPFRTWTFRGYSDKIDISDGQGVLYRFTRVSPAGWEMEETRDGNEVKTVTEIVTTNGNGVTTRETSVSRNSVLASKKQVDSELFDSTPRTLAVRVFRTENDPNPLTTTYQYHDQQGQNGYGQLKSVQDAGDGSWAYYEYNDDGWISKEYRSWADNSPYGDPPSASTCMVVEYSYDPVSGSGDSGGDPRPRRIDEKIRGISTSTTYCVFYTTQVYIGQQLTTMNAEKVIRCKNPNGLPSDTGNLATVTLSYPPSGSSATSGKPYSVQHPDGRFEQYGYSWGLYAPPSDVKAAPGEFPVEPPASNVILCLRTTVDQLAITPPSGTPQPVSGKSTRSVSLTDLTGREVETRTEVWNSTQYEPVEWTVMEYEDDDYRLTQKSHNSGKSLSITYTSSSCCNERIETDEAGIEIKYTTKAACSVTSQKMAQSDWSDAITTTSLIDAAGRVTNVIRHVGETDTQTEPRTESITAYDLAGRVLSRTDESGLTTDYVHETSTITGGRKVTAKYPWDSQDPGNRPTEISEYYPDGRVARVTGTAVVHNFRSYGVNADGTQWSKVLKGDSDESVTPFVKETVTNALGQTWKEIEPLCATSMCDQEIITIHSYDNKGQFIKTEKKLDTTPISADVIYEYDSLGNLLRSGLDLSVPANGILDLNSTDRISETETSYVYENSAWWQLTESRTYLDGSGQPVPTSKVKRRLTGFNGFTGSVIEETISTDVALNATTARVTVDSSNRRVTNTADVPDSSTDEVAVTENGLLESETSKSGVSISYGYDEIGRRETVTDRTGTTTTEYYASSDPVGSRHRVKEIEDPAGHKTTYGYSDKTGRVISKSRIDAQDSSLTSTEYYDYTSRGELWRVWGNGTYPIQYEYDQYGRQSAFSTYRGGSDWDGLTWPEGATGPADRTWFYFGAEASSRQAREKVFPDGKTIGYSYTADGKLYQRTWARTVGGNPLTTTYDYDPKTGDLLGINYSDTTPDVEFTYDRQGRQTQAEQKDGQTVIAAHDFTYDDNEDWNGQELISPRTLRTKTETITRDGYAKLITRKDDARGRDTGFQIGVTGDPDQDDDATYHYDDATGRFSRIEGPGLPAYGVVYTRSANSNAVEYARFNSTQTTVLAQAWRKLESSRNLLDKVDNVIDPDGANTLVSRYDYTNDGLGRRTNVIRTGRAVDDQSPYNDTGFTEDFGYNKRSELETTDRFLWTQSGGPGDRLTTYGEYDYTYDQIGNREEYTLDSSSTSYYCATNVNQYKYVGATQPPDCATVTPTHQYDDDGNLTQDDTFNYTWDAENRLTEIQTRIEAGASSTAYETGDKHVYFTYDYMGRRVHKRVETYNGSSWPETSDQLFIHDGWNVVLVINANATNVNAPEAVVRKYTWGLDLSGSIHGAGGIGGLLAVEETQGTYQGTYWFFYDGNGNVGQLVKTVKDVQGNITGVESTLAAHYEYDPYGNVINSNGPYKDANPIRFSTKWFDAETHLGYWGYRSYSPPLGRWLSRDPIEEKEGGLNLYAFVKNSPIDRWDFLGLWNERDHYAAVKEAAGKAGLCDECATKMAEGAYGQDLWHQLDWPRHFMTDKWGDYDYGAAQGAYLAWELEQVKTHLRKGHCLRALYSYGKIQHTYQDNFAHIDLVAMPGNMGLVMYKGQLVGHWAKTPQHHMSGPNAWNVKRPDDRTLFAADWEHTKFMTDASVYSDREMFFGCPCKCDDPKAKRGF